MGPISAGRAAAAPAATDRITDFDTFYSETAPGLLRQVHAFTGNFAEAQDCVQEAYARAWQRWDRVVEYDAPREWVRTVAIRLSISRFRRFKTALVAYRRAGVEETVPGLEHDAHGVLAVLKQLPDKYREVLVLHYLVDLPVVEVAEILGVPEGTIKARLSRGRKAFADVAGQSEDDAFGVSARLGGDGND